MSAASDPAQEAQWKRWRAVADLYHAYFTGLILTVVTRRGTADAAEFVFRVFRRQQQERFLPGLEKLGLGHLPPAVAAAQYHYLSNWIGGVHVEYMHESDTKAWIRYPPPRWIWKGTAICGVPGEVSRAMLRGWHANNGVALGDLRLGFVCTKQSVDGQDGLEGYYHQYDQPLELDQRLVFARHLEAPLFDAKSAPALPVASWPKPRLEKAYRNYAMEYVRTAAPVMVQLFGPEDAGYLLHLTGKLIGMQYFDEVAAALLDGPWRGERIRDVPQRAVCRAGRCGRGNAIRRHLRNPSAELEVDGRRRRLSPRLRQGAGGIVRGPRCRMRAAHRRSPARARRRPPAVALAHRVIPL
ncbi:hypothetical protein ACVWW5_007784 [Bradyrhizobium sp. LM3.4]